MIRELTALGCEVHYEVEACVSLIIILLSGIFGRFDCVQKWSTGR